MRRETDAARINEDETGAALLGRRPYLKLAGAAVGAVALGSAGASAADSSVIVVDGRGQSKKTEYVIEVSDTITKVDTSFSDSGSDSLSAGTVQGSVAGGVDAYEFTGTIEGFEFRGPAKVSYNTSLEKIAPELTQDTLEVVSDGSISYTFTTTGKITKLFDNGKRSAEEGNDTVTKNDDGTWTASGFTGNGYGDGYAFDGELKEFSPNVGNFTLLLNGEEVSPDDYGASSTKLEVRTSKNPSEVTYRFTTTGRVTKLFNNGENSAEEGNDSITKNADGTWTVSGYTGNGYGDGYAFDGELEAFSPNTGPFTLHLDGKEVSPKEYGDVPQNPGGTGNDSSLIGGGDGYSNVVPKSEATRVVSTFGELRDALDDASSGDVVYVDGGADINMRETRLTVPNGVTLASNRGIGGAKGGRLYTERHPWGMLRVRSNARITGLRIDGPRWDWESDTVTEMAVDARGRNIEVDNVEGYGWGYAVVRTNDDTHVHHCHLHHNSRHGHGYGIATEGSDNPIIEYNLFDHNRHSVQGNGGGYTIRYNVVKEGAISHVFDQHRPGGTTMRIYNNTVEVVDNDIKDKKVPAVAIRGVPSDIADIHHNWFYNPERPRRRPDGWTDEAIIQVHTSSWRNVRYRNNHYGSSEPSKDVGHPR
jgi:hypothetical protein